MMEHVRSIWLSWRLMQGQQTSKTTRIKFPFNFILFILSNNSKECVHSTLATDTWNKSHLSSTKNHHCVERVEEANATVPLVAHDLYQNHTHRFKAPTKKPKCIYRVVLARSFVCVLFEIGLALSR